MDPFDALKRLVAEAIREVLPSVVEEAIHQSLPPLMRRASLPPYLTTQQLSDLTGWSLRTIYRKKEKRRIPYVKRGRTVLFPTDEVLQLLDEAKVPVKV